MVNVSRTYIINEDNLSVAWAKIFLKSISQSEKEIIPLIVMINDLSNNSGCEDMEIRRLLDNCLKQMGKQSSKTVASTIFPMSLWNPKKNRKQLYKRYLQILPEIRRCPKNRYGVYFERLINFNEAGIKEKPANQLESIISNRLSGNYRRSLLQAAIFDPKRDQTNQRQRGFPCLQHITFTPYSACKGLAVNAFYATQYLFERAYGNYLGLYYLGQFVAHELDLELVQMNCMVGIGKLEVYNNHIKQLAERIEKILVKLENK
jgi:thymidylate synthase